jgi:hypothetical protein
MEGVHHERDPAQQVGIISRDFAPGPTRARTDKLCPQLWHHHRSLAGIHQEPNPHRPPGFLKIHHDSVVRSHHAAFTPHASAADLEGPM